MASHPYNNMYPRPTENAAPLDLSDKSSASVTSSVLPIHKINIQERLKSMRTSWWAKARSDHIDVLSEFFGTFVFILLALGSIAQVTLSSDTKGDWQSIAWGHAAGLMLGAYIAGRSGGHLNPAVTFACCLYRRFSWYRFPVYALAQIFGAFCAAGVVYANYKPTIDLFEGGKLTVPGSGSETATAGIFATYPQPFLSAGSEIVSEFTASAILLFCIFALTDKNNSGGAALFTPLALAFVIFGIATGFGFDTGFAINLARDFGPRLFTYMVGYGPGVWTNSGHYAWIPAIVPFFGCAFGGLLYEVFLNTGETNVLIKN